jgi:hypothetical protein
MSLAYKLLPLTLVTLLVSACGTTTRDRVYRNMAVAGSVGFAVGQTQPEYKMTLSTAYAGVGAAVAAALTLYFDDGEKEMERLRAENKILAGHMGKFDAGKVIGQGPATFGATVPDKYKAFINPGEWRIYDLDQWVENDENRLIHQDKMMELIPPSLNPGGQ